MKKIAENYQKVCFLGNKTLTLQRNLYKEYDNISNRIIGGSQNFPSEHT